MTAKYLFEDLSDWTSYKIWWWTWAVWFRFTHIFLFYIIMQLSFIEKIIRTETTRWRKWYRWWRCIVCNIFTLYCIMELSVYVNIWWIKWFRSRHKSQLT